MNTNVKYVWAKENISENVGYANFSYGIVKGKKYEVFAEFDTDMVSSGHVYVILTENSKFVGYDSDYFISDMEHEIEAYNV